jgi:chemotaxis protein MotA
MSKLATFLGLILGIIVIGVNVFDWEKQEMIGAFLSPGALAIVLGGTFAATLVNYPLNQLGCILSGLKKSFFSEPVGVEGTIQQLVALSRQAQAQGILSLEQLVNNHSDPYLRFAMTQLLIHRDEELLRYTLFNHINTINRRHQLCQEIYNNMATYSPAFGMLGTIMGLILMMVSQISGTGEGTKESAEMLESLLQGMGLALITTLYGVLLANLFFIPIAGKLKMLSDREVAKNEVIAFGIISIKRQVSPLLFLEVMTAFSDRYRKGGGVPQQS